MLIQGKTERKRVKRCDNMIKNISDYLEEIYNLPLNQSLSREHLLHSSFLVGKENNVEIYYAPHNEYINREAKIVIVGITPGFQQMKMAYETLRSELANGHSLEEGLKKSKIAGSFAGSMRRNLIHMLEECGLPRALGIKDAASLFSTERNILHTTSVIKYPAFYKGKNYTGSQPMIDRNKLLSFYAYTIFPEELAQLPSKALVIPLGKAVDRILTSLAQEGKIAQAFLTGFPHPSGANGHRRKQFEQRKEALIKDILQWTQERA
jgi:hypothetical protein